VDKLQCKPVCNDSGVMLDMLYRVAEGLPDCAQFDLKPATLADGIDDLNNFIYKNVNNAVYRCASVFIWRSATHLFPQTHGGASEFNSSWFVTNICGVESQHKLSRPCAESSMRKGRRRSTAALPCFFP
jgi:hypothetical protein